MTPSDILVLTALLVVVLVAIALLISGISLMLQGWCDFGAPSAERDAVGPAHRRWRIERLVYRHHRIAGILIVLGSAVFLSQAFHDQALDAWINSFPWTVFWATLMVAHVFTLVVGLVILLRPSRLKAIEGLANRRYDLGFAPVARARSDRPALQGLLLILIATVVLAGMSLLLYERFKLLS